MRYLTAGESHGKGLVVIIEGIPAKLPLRAEQINCELARRQRGYGRGGRMKIERDEAEILAGVRGGLTLGSPIALLIRNRDWENWKDVMDAELAHGEPVSAPRPGHADLAGALKYNQKDIRNILERASARETAARVAAGAVCKVLLEQFGIKVLSYVVQIGGVEAQISHMDYEERFRRAESSPVACPDESAAGEMMARIDAVGESGDSLGGVFEVVILGAPPGLGSFMHWDRRLDGKFAQALMSIPGIKGVEIGLGFWGARLCGSQVHDAIFYEEGRGFYRGSNNAGGLEGGVTTGEPIVLRAAMKPIATLKQPLQSVDIITKEPTSAARERADVCAVPAAAVIGEAMAAFVLAEAMQEKFGGDSLEEMKNNYQNYMEQVRRF